MGAVKDGMYRVMDFNPGDIVRMKKPHPCGGYDWKIIRCGMDFRIECLLCKRQVMLPRTKFEKRVKTIVPVTRGDQSVQ